jgi:hypothetical protein
MKVIMAFYQDNEALINYINHQHLAEILTCLVMDMREYGTLLAIESW